MADCDCTTICDNCGSEVALAEANTGDFGDWDGATLCNECYAELRFAHERDYRDSAPIRKDTVASFQVFLMRRPDGCELWNMKQGVFRCYAGNITQSYAGRPGWPASFNTPRLV